jgi:hypothetical protein
MNGRRRRNMRRRLILGACAALLLSVTGYAADLKNEDGARYEIKISSGASTTSTSVGGNTTLSNVCSGCEIEVVGVGKVQVRGSEVAVIKDGRLGKR